MKTRIILGAVLAAVCGVVILFAQQRPAGPYTADQAAAGRAAYPDQLRLVPCGRSQRSAKGRNWPAPTSWPSGATDRRRPDQLHAIHHASGRRGSARRYLCQSRGVHPGRQQRTARRSSADRGFERCRSAASLPGSARRTCSRARRAPAEPLDAKASRTSRAAGTASAPRNHRRGRSEELRSRHRRHAAQSRSRRLADDPARLQGQLLQPAESDHRAERQRPAAGVELGHAGWREQRQPARAHRPQRRAVCEQRRHGAAGPGCQDRRADLGESLRHQSHARPPCAASRSTTTRFS